MRKLVAGAGLGLAALFTPDVAQAIKIGSPSQSHFLSINFLIQSWLRYQQISDENRPNFVKADNRVDFSFRRIRLRMGGSYNKWFKFNFVMRLNNSGREAYMAPFGGQPAGTIRQTGVLGGYTFALHELDLKFAIDKMIDTKGWIADLHVGFPRVPLGREQYGRTGFDNLESDRTFATLRWTHLTVGDVTGRSYGGFIHLRKGTKAKGYRKITWDGFFGIFDGFEGIRQPWDKTMSTEVDFSGAACASAGEAGFPGTAKCISQMRGNETDSFLYTFRTTLMFGKPEGKAKAYNWLYRDTYLGKRKGVTLGFSYARQDNIDQELITDVQGISPGVAGNGKMVNGAGTVQTRLPYLILPNPFSNPEVINHKVDMQMMGVDFAWHHGQFLFTAEAGQVSFKNVWLSPSNTSESFDNKFFIVKGAWLINPKSVHKFEPYLSYYVWDPEIVEVNNVAYGDAANFVRPNKKGKAGATLGKLKVTSVGINYWYDRAKLLGVTLEYQMIDEERNDIKNDAITLQFRFVF